MFRFRARAALTSSSQPIALLFARRKAAHGPMRGAARRWAQFAREPRRKVTRAIRAASSARNAAGATRRCSERNRNQAYPCERIHGALLLLRLKIRSEVVEHEGVFLTSRARGPHRLNREVTRGCFCASIQTAPFDRTLAAQRKCAAYLGKTRFRRKWCQPLHSQRNGL
jgi:hypothetical protein